MIKSAFIPLLQRKAGSPLRSILARGILPVRSTGVLSIPQRFDHQGPHKDTPLKSTDEEVVMKHLLDDIHPEPVRREFMQKSALNTKELENFDAGIGKHRVPECMSDKIALTAVKLLRFPTDVFFQKKYVYRAIMLETVAAVPGMVAGMLRHLRSLRLVKHDGGWIHHLLHEAENERMHLMTWMKIMQPNLAERALVTLVQGIFFNFYMLTYLFFPKTCHRFVGYLEEEAVISYTAFLQEIDKGHIENIKAPQIAIDYWHLKEDATLRDVVLAVRLDEAAHRDVNHHLSDRILSGKENLHEAFTQLHGKGKVEKRMWSSLEQKDFKV